MRVLILSDIHANLVALEAVLEDASNGFEYESVWCLGDLVGYGPDPNQCIELICSLPDVLCLIGNHDQAAIGMTPLSRFNDDARAIATWTREKLTDDSISYLKSLPSEITIAEFTLAHGSPRRPVWEYILDSSVAAANFTSFNTNYALVGHSHIPLIFYRPNGNAPVEFLDIRWEEPFQLQPRMILNPGSVGQPRDMDPRAAYAILDLQESTWEARRVAYDVEDARARMLEAGLPERQASRLIAGW